MVCPDVPPPPASTGHLAEGRLGTPPRSVRTYTYRHGGISLLLAP